MFLNTSGFKKLLKQAYKAGGITVGRLDEGIFVCGGHWITWFDMEYMPSRIKAAIIEYTDSLPGLGSIMKAGHDAPIQYELDTREIYDVCNCWKSAKLPLYKTPMLLQPFRKDRIYRLFQDKESGVMVPVDESLVQVIDNKELDQQHEGEPHGPSSSSRGTLLYWKNDTCIWAVCSANIESNGCKEILEHLEFLEHDFGGVV